MMLRSEKPDRGTIVYVGGLVEDVKKEDLEVEFEKFGKLNRVWVAFNPPGFAFVEFANKEDAETAVNTLHDANLFGCKLRVEVSRGRGRGGSRGGGGRGDRGGFRGSRGSFQGGRGSDFGRGGGMSRGGFGRGSLFDNDIGYKPFRGDGGGRFDDFDRGRSEFEDRGFGGPRDFASRRELGGRDYGDNDGPRGFGMGRDTGRDFGGRDFPPRDGRDVPSRGGIGERAFGALRDRPRDFGVENGGRNYGGVDDVRPMDRGFGGRDFGPTIVRDYAAPAGRDFGSRDVGGGRDYDVGVRRGTGARDFNSPRDLGDPRDIGGRPSRADFADNGRFGGRGGFGDGELRRPGGFDSRYSGGDVGGSGDYGGYGARDRFRSRSPIGRGSRPLY